MTDDNFKKSNITKTIYPYGFHETIRIFNIVIIFFNFIQQENETQKLIDKRL